MASYGSTSCVLYSVVVPVMLLSLVDGVAFSPLLTLLSAIVSISSTMFSTDNVERLVVELFVDELVVSLLVEAFDIVIVLNVL